jgi:hypothetical protein
MNSQHYIITLVYHHDFFYENNCISSYAFAEALMDRAENQLF